ncbi:hypothetical protein [Listeria seeligeri]|uniref:hypothetical protein n=1 Tax=Listeria seeligeri TaxID=1640 RepID=UPI0022EA99DB|nr:hypothetical protein [Listeria seeligeri]
MYSSAILGITNSRQKGANRSHARRDGPKLGVHFSVDIPFMMTPRQFETKKISNLTGC